MKLVRKYCLKGGILLSSLVLALSLMSSVAYAFNKNLLASDSIFDAKSSMSATQIDNFLNSQSHSCIKSNIGFRAVDPTGYNPTDGYTYGGYVTAGTVIYHAAQAYDINPRVLIATLQKEQSLVSGITCTTLRYTGAMGYGCPDGGTTHNYSGLKLYKINSTVYSSVTGTCVNSAAKAGFSQQIIHAAWLLKFGEQRSKGNVSWSIVRGNWDNSDDPQSCYSGPMTKGTFSRGPSNCGSATFDGYTTIDNTATYMGSGSTATLYWYTPHFAGNQSFVNIYTGWFGSPTSGCTTTANVTNAASGRDIIAIHHVAKGADNLSFTRQNNTGSTCAEVHLWNSTYHNFVADIATNLSSLDPTNSRIISGNMSGDGTQELLFVKYQSGSGRVEVHTWDSSYHNWVGHAITPLPNLDPTKGEIVTGDMNGDGHDELLYIKYSGTGGHTEVHTFSSDYHSWTGHALTNVSNLNPNNGAILTGDMNGDGHDELLYVKYSGASGHVEIHTMSSDYHSWVGHALTMLGGLDPTKSSLITGNLNGDSRDEILFIKYLGTGSGMVEVHTMSKDYHSWTGHAATNLSTYDPAT